MSVFDAIIGGYPAVAGHRPWPRFVIDSAAWNRAAEGLRDGAFVLVGYWGDADRVHLALAEPTYASGCVLTLPCPDGRFPSLAVTHPPSARLERAIQDLWMLTAQGAADRRSWLDHGRWPTSAERAKADYAFLPVEGEGLHRIPVGPVHAGIIEPGHFRFTASGEAVVRLEARLGYVHKGIEGLMAGAPLAKAARLAGRVSGDSTVAYALAFARAVEVATEAPVPPRAVWLRALMAELERIANHLGDIGAICNDAAFAIMLAHCGVLRERVLRTANTCFGHRLMMDRVIPGGIGVDLADEGAAAIEALIRHIRDRFPELVELYDNTASLQDRTVATGRLQPALAQRFAAGGVIGRASGRAIDVRRHPGYPPYDDLPFQVPVREDGDVNARVWVRIGEVEQSLALLSLILSRLPSGPIAAEVPCPATAVEGLALVEGFRGDVLVWLRLGRDAQVERCHFRDPSWFQWPLLEAVIEGNIVADFPLCNKSFNCSYSGHDL
ncbi:MAG: hydrogenase expression protein HypE [Rhodospirillales bacterium]|nr:hydrogenase expression protein HypE [Rhodospirillales bacterium]